LLAFDLGGRTRRRHKPPASRNSGEPRRAGPQPCLPPRWAPMAITGDGKGNTAKLPRHRWRVDAP